MRTESSRQCTSTASCKRKYFFESYLMEELLERLKNVCYFRSQWLLGSKEARNISKQVSIHRLRYRDSGLVNFTLRLGSSA